MKLNHTRLTTTTAFSAAFALIAGSPLIAEETTFNFAFPNAINVSAAPFAFAERLNYFEEEELNVEYNVLVGSGVIIPQLMKGSINSTYMSLEPLPIARQPGKPNFAFRFAYNFVPNTLWEFTVPVDSDIQTLADLKGLTIGVGGMSWGYIPGTRGALAAAGLGPNDVEFAAVGSGAPALEAIRKGQVDALNLYDTKNVDFELTGFAMRRLPLPESFAKMSSHGLPFTDKAIASSPDIIIGFGRAVAKGTLACDADIENCVRAFWDRWPELRPTAEEVDAKLAHEVAVLRARLNSMIPSQPAIEARFGAFSEAQWKPILDSLEGVGLIEDANLPHDLLYTNEFVDGFNDFDRELVIEQAKAYVADGE